MLKNYLPELYQKILPTDVLQISIVETKAQCGQCNKAQPRTAENGSYKEHLKCCTFEPFLPNYLVGAILKSSLFGKKALVEKIKQKKCSLPIGVRVPWVFQKELHENPTDFGNREDWLCSYYDRTLNQCGIWKYRGSVCTSFYCQSSYQEKGIEFWRLFAEYMNLVEMGLAQEVLVHMDFSSRQIDQMLGALRWSSSCLLEKEWDISQTREIWQDRFEQQEEFYEQCYKFVCGQISSEWARNLDRNMLDKVLQIGLELKSEQI